MNTTYESISFNRELPVKLLLHSAGFVQNHWHDALEILFMLEGSINIVSEGNKFALNREDLHIVCPNVIHNITSSERNVVLLLQISKEFTDKHLGQNFTLRDNIEANSKLALKKMLAQMTWINNTRSSFYSIEQLSLLYSIVFILARKFLLFNKNKDIEKHKYNERIESLIVFIQDNFKEDITLDRLSRNYHLTPSYVSRFFTNNIGATFKRYLSNLRLEYAVKEIISTDKNILDIALESGFPNAKSLATEFKRAYSGTINQYRQKYKQNKGIELIIKRPNTNYTQLKSNDYFSTLFKYLDMKDSQVVEVENASKNLELSLSVQGSEKTHIKPYWKEVMSVGRAKDLLREDLRCQLRRVQAEIGFRNIRFHGIFDDSMMVYSEDEGGNVLLNFDYIDNIIDFLLSINLKPFVEIGFMPVALAKNKTPYFYSPSYPSPPNNIKKWLQLLNGFITHLFDRYSSKEVCS